MELQELCAALRATVSANRDEMKHAEAVLKQHETVTGHASNLFLIVVEESVEGQVRLSAAISLKRIVERAWDPEEDMPKLSEQDKTQIRANIIEAVVRSVDPIQSQLIEVLKAVVYADFPESWPELNNAVVQSLHTQDERQVLGALLALRCIARKFEFKTDAKQELFDELMKATLPKVLEILRDCAVSEEPKDVYAEVLKAICKFFWSVTFTKMPHGLEEPSTFKHLMDSLLILIKKELPWNLMPASRNEQDGWIWWKSKKWVLHLTTRFFKNYGSVERTKDGEKLFAEMFTANLSIPMLEAHIQFLDRIAQLPFSHDRVYAQLVNYMEHATNIPQTYKILKPHLKPMLINIVFPLLCFNDSDAQLMTEDPEEYVRKSHDFIEDVFGVKAAAGNFTLNLCRTRKKLVLEDFTNHLLTIMRQYTEARKNGNEPIEMARLMDGALTAFGTLESVLVKKARKYKGVVEDLLQQCVLPCFQSQFGHLRSRACWVAGRFSSTKFKDGRGSGATFRSLLEVVVLSMKDTELPVRVDAVIALKFFVDAMDTLDDFKFILKDLLNVFFSLMNEIENEDIVFTLESIVDKLGEDIAPFAEDLGFNLAAAFKKCIGTGVDEEEDFESLCAYGCIRAMNTLIESVRKSPPLYRTLEETFYPVIDTILAKENVELIDDILDMISCFTYFSTEISPRMWALMPRLHAAYMTWAFDYFECLAVCFGTYIVKGREVFLQNKQPDYMSLFNQVLENAMTGDYQEVDFHPALKLMETAMQHLKRDIDAFVGPYLHLTLQKWRTAERSDTRVLLVNVVANALWYNPVIAVAFLRQQGALMEVFSKWFEMIYTDKENGRMKYFLKHSDKKIGILGLISLLAVPDDQFPNELQAGQILGGVMKLLAAIRRQEEEMRETSEDEDYDPDEDSEGELGDADEEEDDDESAVESSSGSAYNKLLEKETRKLLLGYQGSDSDDYCETDMSSDDEDAPIYTVDPYVTFSEMLEYLETTHGNRLQEMVAGMNESDRQALHQMMDYGRQKKAEAENGITQHLNGN